MGALPLATEPRDLLLGPDNDLVISATGLDWVRGIDAVAQSCRIAVQMFKGEWFADLDAGIGYWDDLDGTPGILGAKPSTAILRARSDYRDVLSARTGVLEVLVLRVSFDGATRALSVVWQVRTAFGDTVLDTIKMNTP